MLRTISQLILAALLATGLMVSPVHAEEHYTTARSLVQRTQDDLQRARDNDTTKTAKALERIDNAKKHLADFDRKLAKNDFSGDRLNEAIDDVKNVVDNNPLLSADRDALSVDLADLRHLRETKH